MITGQIAQRAFYCVSALLFIVSAVVTVVWCSSMSAGGMPMPGGWTMSMAWMRMPGQTWSGAALSFVGMWFVMMVAMMLPSLMPMLLRYRRCHRSHRRATSVVADCCGCRGIFLCLDADRNRCVSAGCRAGGAADAIAGAGAWCSDRGGDGRVDRGCASVHCVESASPGLLSKAVAMASCAAGECRDSLAPRFTTRSPLRLLLRWIDGDPARHRRDGFASDAGRGDSDHARTSRSGWSARREGSRRDHSRRGSVSNRASGWAGVITPWPATPCTSRAS